MIELKNSERFKFNDDDGKHVHLMDGSPVPGCTSVSGLFSPDGWKFAWPVKLMEEYVKTRWKKDTVYFQNEIDHVLKEGKNAWREKRDKSADSGVKGHTLIEEYLKHGHLPTLTQGTDIENIFNQFMLWEGEIKPKWLASELQVGSLTHSYCGILDALAEINGKVVLLDFKTGSSGDKKEFPIQLAGLAMALEEQGVKVDERAILHLPKKGNFEYFPITSDLEWEKKAFLAGLKFLSYKNQVLGGEK